MKAAALALGLALHGAALAAPSEPAKAPPAKDESAKDAPATKHAPSTKGAPSTKAETAKADQNRKKPLQRCDELKEQAQLDCLKKARERIVEARNKRETKAAGK